MNIESNEKSDENCLDKTKPIKTADKLNSNGRGASDLKKNLEESSGFNRGLLIFFLLAMTYFLVIVASTTDLQLLLPNSTIHLPILNVPLDLIDFYLFSPFILIVIHFNFLFSLRQHTKKLTVLKAIEKNNDNPLPHTTFLINLLIKPKQIQIKDKNGKEKIIGNRMPYYLIRILLWIVIYLYPLFILVYFQWRFSDYHDLLWTFVHFLYVALDLALLSFFWIRISDPDFESHSFKVFTIYSENEGQHVPNQTSKKRQPLCDSRRDKVDKILYFIPCLVGKTLYYLKRNTGTINLIIIILFGLIQFRIFGILKVMDVIPPGVAYRIVNKYEWIIPRLKVLDQPIVAHYRKLALPLPYADEELAKKMLALIQEHIRSQQKTGDTDNKQNEDDSTENNKKLSSQDPCKPSRTKNTYSGSRLNLSGRDLRFANLDKSDLTGVLLRQTRLQGASLMEATLDEAEMYNVNLQGANLKRAKLNGAILNGAHLEEAILEDAKMEGAVLGKASLDGADLTWANLKCAEMAGASFIGAILQKAILQHSTADWSVFRAADLTGVDLKSSHLRGADFFGADLNKSNFYDAILVDADLSATNMEGSDLRKANLLGTNLYAANLKSVDLTDVELTGVNVRYAQVWSSDVKEGVPFDKSSMYGLYYFDEVIGNGDVEICIEIKKKIVDISKYWEQGAKVVLSVDRWPQKNCDFKKDEKIPEMVKDVFNKLKPSDEPVKADRLVLIEKVKDDDATEIQRKIDFELKELNYRLRLNIVCDSVYTAKGIARQLLFEKKLEPQRRALNDYLKQTCPSITEPVIIK